MKSFILLALLIGCAFSQNQQNRPTYAPVSFDCRLRSLAVEYARSLQPWMGEFSTVSDALEIGTFCGVGASTKDETTFSPRRLGNSKSVLLAASDSNAIYVAPRGKGVSSTYSDGTKMFPYYSLQEALAAAVKNQKKTVLLMPGTHFIGETVKFGSEHSGMVISGVPGEEWPTISGGIPLNISKWSPVQGPQGANIWVANVAGQVQDIPGLRVDGGRAWRARYPNSNPERTIPDRRLSGKHTQWLAPKKYPDPYYVLVGSPARTWMQTFQNYQVGIGGPCSIYDPPVSYWCSNNTQGGGAFQFRVPSGLSVNTQLLPHFPYKNGAKDAVINIWRPSRWEVWMFNFSQTGDNGQFVFDKGGFQGARGSDTGGDWYIENILDELDEANEFFFDKSTGNLFLYYNGTGQPPAGTQFVALSTKVLFSLYGSQQNPINGITIQGLRFTEAAPTFMDPHGVPSGGDWALQRSAAVFLQNTANVLFQENLIERVDGNGLMLSGYNRNTTIQRNEIAWIGDTAMAAWGITDDMSKSGAGISGMDGNQPRGARILNNVVREVGMYQKQSSFWVQAKSCQSLLKGNVFFNGPRAGVNFNDGFGGANEIVDNLIFNTCRESSDHGPFNSWDRQPFLTDVRNGTASLMMQWNHIHHNFLIANYRSSQAIDNDDGSAYYHSHHNFMAYSPNGMKTDFSGHDNVQHSNVYAYLDGPCMSDYDVQLPGHIDYFYNNTCVLTQDGNYVSYSCNDPNPPTLSNNRVYTPSGTTKECDIPLAQYQNQSKRDPGTSVKTYPSDTDIITWGRALLGLP